MPWSLKGSYVETCSCELMCPCNMSFDHGATYDYCRVTLVFSIREGEIDGTDVGGEVVGDVLEHRCFADAHPAAQDEHQDGERPDPQLDWQR